MSQYHMVGRDQIKPMTQETEKVQEQTKHLLLDVVLSLALEVLHHRQRFLAQSR